MAVKNRFSVAFDEQEYGELAAMAQRYRVSMAWLVRHAVTEFCERYRDEELQLPLHFTPTRSEPRGT